VTNYQGEPASAAYTLHLPHPSSLVQEDATTQEQQHRIMRFLKAALWALLATFLIWTPMVAAQGAGTLSFNPAIVEVSEGAGSVTLTVTRTSGSTGAISVQYATQNGSAMAGTDYTATSGTLMWADGDAAAKTITLPVIQNNIVDGTRYFNVLLSNATGGATIAMQNGTVGKAIVRVNDDESDPYPPGGLLPVAYGFVANGSGPWTVSHGDGYHSANALKASDVKGYTAYSCVYDSDLGEYVCDPYPANGIAKLTIAGDFLDGEFSFAFKVRGTPGDAKAVWTRLTGGETDSCIGYSISSDSILANGNTGWTTVSFPVSAGRHCVEIGRMTTGTTSCSATVAPDPDGTPCDDSITIDNLSLPPAAARLKVSKAGSGGGTVLGNSINCGSTCEGFYTPGAVVTLSAVPGPDMVFVGWQGACAGTVECTLTMDVGKYVTALFSTIGLQSVKSKKTHASAGAFELAINRIFPGEITVEPRESGGAHEIEFTFDRSVTGLGSVSTNLGMAVGTYSQNKINVRLSNLYRGRATINLYGVASAQGAANFAAFIDFLPGDVTQSGKVGAADIIATKVRKGPVTPDNFRFDVDLSGTIDDKDVALIRSRSGSVIAP
jgi:hypothetical protein